MTIAIGCDHAGYELKAEIIKHFSEKGFVFDNKGTDGPESVDYPDFAHAVASAVEAGADRGILICGSAQGVAMTANKHQSIRAAVIWNKEIATLSRQHNDANIICLPARFLDTATAMECIEAFANTAFEGGRHQGRVSKMSC